MDDIVAVKVVDGEGKMHYFLTWGRIFGSVDPQPLLQVITAHLSVFGIQGVEEISLCSSLREASAQPYFYEAFFAQNQQKIPYGEGYAMWQKERKDQIEKGKEIYYLGTD